ncbi:TonB-dependent receptor [Pseudoduganella aquatica]|uniref:TonB-dependent receptor n=1 Tax=Pseudoduganella aquatica TaxID=2660641 RepID=A0A7X4HAR4_9BURK|nr:TonB-dependent receptor [Pseudoduganella aquatica]MYN07399.1 TonB-dependent receptor [Pseudoduganella aquatica]
MTFSNSSRAPASSPLALAVALCFSAAIVSSSAMAQTQIAGDALAAVVVTGARFDSDPSLLPIGATVISAAEIRRAGVSDVNQAIRKIGGVLGHQSLDGSPDFALDLRGFGTNSSQNMVVLLDGVRLSENELSSAILSTIPVDSVERIEITRGGSSVLFGDGATGGVIQIITKRPGARNAGTHGSVYAEVGQFGLREGRAALTHSTGDWAFDLSGGALDTDNYRDNNAFKSRSVNAGAQVGFTDGRAGVRLSSTRQDSRFAGSLSQAQFDANPRQAATPKDFGALDSDRFTAFVEAKLAGYDLAAELSHRRKELEATYFHGTTSSVLDYESKQTQFSPRVRKLGQFGGVLNEAVAGVDFIDWTREQKGSSPSKATQKSKALYLRDEVKWDAFRLAAGVRRELFEKTNADPSPWSVANYDVTQGVNAWDVQGSYALSSKATLHAKAGHSYRVANADENGYTLVPNTVLQPQTSHDLELGTSYTDGGAKLSARVFRHELRNEIYYDPTAGAFGFGANTNLAPTKRQGFELDASAELARDWTLSGHYQRVKATFTEGAIAGREMVLVPKNVLSARLTWTPADGQTADIGAQWVDSQRFGSDFTNSCAARIPSYTTLDARYARKFGAWEVALAGLNLADKQYYGMAFQCRGGIYSSDGRQLKLSARYEF